MCPQTFMNLSGDAVREAADFYKIPPSNIIVLFDDVSLPCGKLRIRRSGSDGGQKGMRDIILKLNTDNIPRIKLGIGEKTHPEMDLADYVLSKFNKAEQESLYGAIERAFDALPLMLFGDIDGAMARFN
jgi:PTH1 family peptidyl-tRNA hydrolase